MVTIASFLRTGAKQTLQWTAPAEPSKNCLLIPLNQRAVGSPPPTRATRLPSHIINQSRPLATDSLPASA